MKKRTILGVCLVLFLAGGVLGQSPHHYQGMNSTAWIEKLKGGHVQDRRLAAGALGQIAIQVRQAFEEQSEKAAKVRPAVNRMLAVKNLGLLTAPSPTIVSALTAAVSDSDATTRERAKAALEQWQLVVKAAVAFYRARLRDDDFAPRMQSARCLGELGPLAKDAIQDLQAAARDPEDRVRKEALAALTAIQRNSGAGKDDRKRLASVSDMVRNLQDQRTSVRVEAAKSLGPLCWGDEAAAKIGVPALVRALSDYDTYVRRMAAESLGQIGPLARSAREPLQRATQTNRDLDVVKAAQDALTKIGN